MTRNVRIAVAGAGLIGKDHIRRVAEGAGTELCAVIDPAPAGAELAARHGAAHFTDLVDGLKASRAEGVILATPNTLHAEQGLAAVGLGIPALVEKPFTHTVEAGEALVAAAAKAGVPLLTGHHHRHSPHMRRAKETIASGALGRLVAVNAMYWFRKPDKGYFDGPGAWRKAPGGGPILINLIHYIDDLRNLMGDVVAAQAMTANAVRGFDVEDTAAILLRFANGALGTIALSDSAASPWSWEFTSGEQKNYPMTEENYLFVAGTTGSLAVPRQEFWHYRGEPHWFRPIDMATQRFAEEDPLVNQIANFRDVILGKAAPVVSGAEGLATLKATLAVKQAAETGVVVSL
jgi:predicted dehydrogenase